MIDLPPAQVHCIAQAVFHEARGESAEGKKAVAHVVLNRTKKTNKTPCQVLKQPGQFQVKLRKSYSGSTWKDCYKLALNPGLDPTRGALYFKTASSGIKWGHKFIVRIGQHNFYK